MSNLQKKKKLTYTIPDKCDIPLNDWDGKPLALKIRIFDYIRDQTDSKNPKDARKRLMEILPEKGKVGRNIELNQFKQEGDYKDMQINLESHWSNGTEFKSPGTSCGVNWDRDLRVWYNEIPTKGKDKSWPVYLQYYTLLHPRRAESTRDHRQ